MNRLNGKRTLITGGTTGIGLETARQFIKEGARVAITGRDPETLDAARKELGSSVVVLSSNAGDIPGQQRLAGAIRDEFKELDVLVVNAGIGEFRPLEQWDEAGFDRSFAINLKGPFFLIQALLPVFANPASIVLNTSINAHLGMPNSSIYAATKAALLSLARTFSGELISRGIRVNAVSPGPISTPFHQKLAQNDAQREAMSKYITSQVPAGRFGNATEIAQAMVFLASDEAAFAVGTELVIDGGMSTL
jgi:NAD(P)-dependent dehydrogenase (short-subunit alcohol dehydrogenase family)